MPRGVTSTKGQRVLLAVDCERYSTEALETAVHIAASMQAELQCVFVEDERLLQTADLPFTREVLTSNASERQLSSHRLLRSLKGYSQQVKQDLAERARRCQLHYSFRAVRTSAYQAMLGYSSSADLLLFGDKHSGLSRHTRFASRTELGEVCVFIAGQEIDKRLMGPAVSLAGWEHRNLKLYVRQGAGISEPTLAAMLKGYLGPTEIEPFEKLSTLLQSLVQAKHWQTLVLPLTALTGEEALFNQLLAQPGRRIILVRESDSSTPGETPAR